MDLYITGAGISAESGIPTFRGSDGIWTIGSKNYTPQEMATRVMYKENPSQFLLWYYKRFVKYRNAKPNKVHKYLVDKNLITQNIDGLDYKAGNKDYIAIHGNLHKVSLYHSQNLKVDIENAPWKSIERECPDLNDLIKLKNILLDFFKISKNTLKPEKMVSLKPFVLLFDEFYTDNYGISKANQLMDDATRFIFLGTSFSVNITSMVLEKAINKSAIIEIVDPNPLDLRIKNIIYHKKTALEYISSL
mgnify:CR=1 FL=1|tara:strand:- start:269 stop:1012 length:744 start_codon:yes stop_codon:yes gene_type:complete